MSEPINTHGWEMPFGKHKGTPITRVPVGYLRWWVNQKGAPHKEYARAELYRRGSVLPEIELSGHAIDRASLRCWKQYRADRRKKEGLYAWLQRIGQEARAHGVTDPSGRYLYKGLKLAFEDGEEFPVLVTIMPAVKAPEGDDNGAE